LGNHVCPWRHAYLFDNPLRRLLHDPKKILGPYLVPGMTVLDIGCGMGFFSIGMARLVGNDGLVISVDVEQEMLDVLRKRAARAGIGDRIQTHRCTPEDLGVTTKVDFILAFWMVHEVPDRMGLFRQLRSLIHANGNFLVVEPKMHVSSESFQETLELAGAAGWRCSGDTPIRLSRSAILNVTAPLDTDN
jgi:ubiquinone/menaquinone biosynthesis C-methylase UbiE